MKLMLAIAILYMKTVKQSSSFPLVRVLQWLAKLYVVSLTGVMALQSTTQGFMDPESMKTLTLVSDSTLIGTWICFTFAGEYLCLLFYRKLQGTTGNWARFFIVVSAFPIAVVTIAVSTARFLVALALFIGMLALAFVSEMANAMNKPEHRIQNHNAIQEVAAHADCLQVWLPFSKLFLRTLSPLFLCLFFIGFVVIFVIALIPVLFFFSYGLVGEQKEMLLLIVQIGTGERVQPGLQTVAFVMSVLEGVRCILVVMVKLAIKRCYTQLVDVLWKSYRVVQLIVLLTVLEHQISAVRSSTHRQSEVHGALKKFEDALASARSELESAQEALSRKAEKLLRVMD